MSSQTYTEKPKRSSEPFFERRIVRKTLVYIIKYSLAVVVLIYSAFPIIWTISAAFNPGSSLSGQQLIPEEPTFDNFNTILNDEPYFTWLWNSVKIAGISAILSSAIMTMAAYAFSRYRFWGRSNMLAGILLITIFPSMLAMVAIYTIMLQIGQYIPWLGLNSHGGLILIYIGGTLGFNVWLMKGFFDSIPRELDESAMVDGATRTEIFFKIILPLVRPMIAVVAVLSFFGIFGDWFWPNIILNNKDQQIFTLMQGLQQFIGNDYATNWGPYAAGAVIGAFPQLVVYFILQDWIIGGLTAGSVKG